MKKNSKVSAPAAAMMSQLRAGTLEVSPWQVTYPLGNQCANGKS